MWHNPLQTKPCSPTHVHLQTNKQTLGWTGLFLLVALWIRLRANMTINQIPAVRRRECMTMCTLNREGNQTWPLNISFIIFTTLSLDLLCESLLLSVSIPLQTSLVAMFITHKINNSQNNNRLVINSFNQNKTHLNMIIHTIIELKNIHYHCKYRLDR